MQKLWSCYMFNLLQQFSKGYSQKGLHVLELDVPFTPRAYFYNPNFSSYSAGMC